MTTKDQCFKKASTTIFRSNLVSTFNSPYREKNYAIKAGDTDAVNFWDARIKIYQELSSLFYYYAEKFSYDYKKTRDFVILFLAKKYSVSIEDVCYGNLVSTFKTVEINHEGTATRKLN